MMRQKNSTAAQIIQPTDATDKKEMNRLVKIGASHKIDNVEERSEWAFPTFTVPKKLSPCESAPHVHVASDLWELNNQTKRTPCPLPKIQDFPLNLEGFKHATSTDLNMGFWNTKSNPNASRLCTIVPPWGECECEHLCLPMGLSNAPDVFQEGMSELLNDLEFVRACIDDVIAFAKGSWNDHLNELEMMSQRLQSSGLKINAEKSFFG